MLDRTDSTTNEVLEPIDVRSSIPNCINTLHRRRPVPVAARSKAWFCNLLLGLRVQIPAGSIDV